MRIQTREDIGGDSEKIVIVPESLDDLWHLQFILEPGDTVIGETTRRVRRKEEISRETSGQREYMRVVIEIETLEFHKFSNRLRVSGMLTECPYEEQIGTHHTLNVEIFDTISIQKKWKSDQIQRIEEAVAARDSPDILVATIEEGAAFVQTINQYGISDRANLSGSTGKGEGSERTDIFEELLAVLTRIEVDVMVLAGPGFTKENALEYIKSRDGELARKIILTETSSVGERGVQEVLSGGTAKDIIVKTRIGKETQIVEEIKKRIKISGLVAYGPEEVRIASEYGAIENLVIVDGELQEEREGRNLWKVDVDEIIEMVGEKGGEITIVSKEYGPGGELKGLGGIAALLRFRVN